MPPYTENHESLWLKPNDFDSLAGMCGVIKLYKELSSTGSSDLVPHQLAEAKNPFLTQDKQDVETQTDQGDGKEGCGMM